jgi:hypothetical protein
MRSSPWSAAERAAFATGRSRSRCSTTAIVAHISADRSQACSTRTPRQNAGGGRQLAHQRHTGCAPTSANIRTFPLPESSGSAEDDCRTIKPRVIPAGLNYETASEGVDLPQPGGAQIAGSGAHENQARPLHHDVSRRTARTRRDHADRAPADPAFRDTEDEPMPQRLRRSRRKGARPPGSVVVVTRPTEWTNPHPLEFGRRTACPAPDVGELQPLRRANSSADWHVWRS